MKQEFEMGLAPQISPQPKDDYPVMP